MSWNVESLRRSASLRMKFNNHVGNESEILDLDSPSIVLRPAPSRTPPVPIPPIIYIIFVPTKLSKSLIYATYSNKELLVESAITMVMIPQEEWQSLIDKLAPSRR